MHTVLGLQRREAPLIEILQFQFSIDIDTVYSKTLSTSIQVHFSLIPTKYFFLKTQTIHLYKHFTSSFRIFLGQASGQ